MFIKDKDLDKEGGKKTMDMEMELENNSTVDFESMFDGFQKQMDNCLSDFELIFK